MFPALLPSPLPVSAAWALVVLSGLFEIGFSLLMKQSDGFSRPLHAVGAITAAAISVWLISLSLRALPLGTAYAVWAGIGTLGTAVMGVWLWGETVTLPKAGFMLLIVVGIVGLQLQSAE